MTTRRTFIQQAGVLSAAALLFNSCSVLSSQREKLLGIQLYTLRNQLFKDAKDTIIKIAAAGYNDVETFGYDRKNHFFGLTPKEFKMLLSDNNLISSCGHYNSNDFIRSNSDDEIKMAIEAANAINQKCVIVPYLVADLRDSEDDYKRIAEKLNRAALLCKDANLELAYHNHDFEFTQFGSKTGYDILLDETEAANVKMELDLYWITRAGKDPLAYFEKYPGRFISFHIKDMGKDKVQNTNIGEGIIDFKTILSRSKQAGAKYYFVEYDELPKEADPFESIAKSNKYVRANLL
ncbi:sugar phosphate isomerase/epimerase family protein [Daejeonella oryzae]|uniref:sugar phosphate isomerase/epimerase family protein n=1 Tax=Daejeonella oryzae TaxID=1122943 RepID=UPI0004057974|nr:sugar phosphate isomerase/epimerase [Daejeonella oryzae]